MEWLVFLNAFSSVELRVSSGSSINIVTDNSSKRTYLPDVRISDFRNGLGNLGEPNIIKELTSLSPATTIMNSLDLRNKISVWLIAKRSLMPKESGIVGVCGKWSPNPQALEYAFFYADSVQKVSAIKK